MTFPMPSLPLAVGIETFGTIIFLVIALIGWLINLANQKNQPPPPVRRGGGRPRLPRGRGERLSNEIDVFLQEVGGQKRKRPGDEEIEIVLDEVVELDRPQPPRRLSAAPLPIERLEKPPSPRRVPVGSKFDESVLGSGLREHLAEYMDDDRIELEVAEHLGDAVNLGDAVDESVEEHLGVFSAFSAFDNRETTASGGTEPSSLTTGRLVSLLRDPASVRQAILLNEILSRPRYFHRGR